MTWYCISLPSTILLLWLIYQTIFMFLISKVMKKNRNEDPTVSLSSGQNQGNAHSNFIGIFGAIAIAKQNLKHKNRPGFVDRG